MSDMLSIGASGVRAYQGALSTVGENIANAGVAGYSRRSVNLSEVSSANASITARYVTSGNGVVLSGISRTADPFRALALRQATSDLGRTATTATTLEGVEGALTDAKLSERLTSFFESARTLAADPTSIPSRAVMLEQASSAALAFRTTGDMLDRRMDELDASAKQGVADLNSLATALARVNDGLGRTSPGTATSAQLLDQRDQLLEQMSAITDLEVRTDDIGRATVTLGGAGGATFVQGGVQGYVSYFRSETGTVSFVMQRSGATAAFTPTAGALSGAIDGAQRIAETRTTLNAIAADFTTAVNDTLTAGDDLDGKPGTNLFAVGASPTDLSVALTDPRGIAAAARGGGMRDASNLQALQAARGDGRFEGRVTGLVTLTAAALEQRRTVADAQNSIRDGAIAARDQVSAVDLDNEAVELLRFQQAYQASSRVIQVARDVMQSILEIR